jgi:hypothetical protein
MNFIKIFRSAAIATMALAFVIQNAFADEYDIVINNGRVMDPETLFDGIRNVGIKDSKIASSPKINFPGLNRLMPAEMWSLPVSLTPTPTAAISST